MRNRTLVVVLAMLICLAVAMAAVAAPAKPAAKSAKPAAKSAAKPAAKPAPAAKEFDLDAVLDETWKSPDSTVVGPVDGASVTKGELMHALWYWKGPELLNELLSQKMIEQAAKKAGAALTPAEQKEKEMEAVKRMGLKTIPELLKQFKVPKDRFHLGIRVSALAEKTVNKNVKVTDAEFSEWIMGRHILIRFPEAEKDQAKKEEIAKAKIDEVSAKLKAGEDFAKLADEYSEDPGNMKDGKKQGGSLDWFTKGRMVAEFEKAAFEMPVGKVSEPIKTFYGFHLIRVDALGKDASPAEKAELKKMILEKKVPMEMQRWFSEVQAKAKIDNKLQDPAPKEPAPVMRPQPAPRPNTAPAPAPKPATAPKPPAPAATPPPPPPAP